MTDASSTDSTPTATRWPISRYLPRRCTSPWRRCSVPASENTMRVYIPATVPMLRELVANRELRPAGGTAFAVTPTLREAYASGDDDELAEVAMAEAARASLRLLAAEREEAT